MPNKYDEMAEAVCMKVIGYISLTGNGDLRAEISKAIQTAAENAVERQIEKDASIVEKLCDLCGGTNAYTENYSNESGQYQEQIRCECREIYIAHEIRTQKREA